MTPEAIGGDQHIGAALARVIGDQLDCAGVLADALGRAPEVYLSQALGQYGAVQQAV